MDLQVQPESDHTSEVQKLQSISLLENDGKTREPIYWTAMFLTNGKPFLAPVKSSKLADSQFVSWSLSLLTEPWQVHWSSYVSAPLTVFILHYCMSSCRIVHVFVCVNADLCALTPMGKSDNFESQFLSPSSLRQGLLLVPEFTRLAGDSPVLTLI